MALLEVHHLHTVFDTPAGTVPAVRGVSFTLERGQTLGLVGESGSGKSVTAYSILQILEKNGRIQSGSIRLEGQELEGVGEKVMKTIRGNRISIIFQDPMTSLNPTYTVGRQLMEAVRLHTHRTRRQAWERCVELLRLVNINEPEKRMKQYPFELSGGMRQRVMIAMALACEPDVLIADEPTTALDVTVQQQILELMKDLQRKMGMAILMITHDLGVVAGLCDRVVVMYAGTVCEQGPVEAVFDRPGHQYTKGLLRSVPSAGQTRLTPIPGTPVDLLRLPAGCPFAPRCQQAMHVCIQERCPRTHLAPHHTAYCWMNHKPTAQKEGSLGEHHPVGRATPPETIL